MCQNVIILGSHKMEEELPYPEENRHDFIDFLIENENNGNINNFLKRFVENEEL